MLLTPVLNRAKEAKNQKDLAELGWNAVVVWECQLTKKHRDATLEEVVARRMEKRQV